MLKTELAPGRTRRSYPKGFKAQIVARCRHPEASIAAVALEHGINANLVHKWIRAADARETETPAFLPVAAPTTPIVQSEHRIEIHLKRNQTEVTVYWPVGQAAVCAIWLQECLA